MDPDLSDLDAFLAEAGTDGYLLNVAPSVDADQYYLSGFWAEDPFTTLYTGGETVLLVSSLEYGRARNESRADVVKRWADYDMMAKIEEYGDSNEAAIQVLTELFDEFDVESVSVPFRFPAGHADGLEEAGIPVEPEADGAISEIRSVKTDAEIDWVREAQDANEVALARAQELIEAASVRDGELVLDGEPLTSERVRQEIEITLIRSGCGMDEAIVACGPDGGEPHNRGSGPLRPDEPIVIDVFPRDRESKYHADMTRTFVKGEASEMVREWYDLTADALEAALDAVGPEATGSDVHDAACDVYEDAGYPTLRSDPSTETGFIHSTGHGVGLEVHEGPSISPAGDDELEVGQVITIEPGLYDPEIGGMRLEDLVVVTEDGHENLTDYPLDLELD